MLSLQCSFKRSFSLGWLQLRADLAITVLQIDSLVPVVLVIREVTAMSTGIVGETQLFKTTVVGKSAFHA